MRGFPAWCYSVNLEASAYAQQTKEHPDAHPFRIYTNRANKKHLTETDLSGRRTKTATCIRHTHIRLQSSGSGIRAEGWLRKWEESTEAGDEAGGGDNRLLRHKDPELPHHAHRCCCGCSTSSPKWGWEWGSAVRGAPVPSFRRLGASPLDFFFLSVRPMVPAPHRRGPTQGKLSLSGHFWPSGPAANAKTAREPDEVWPCGTVTNSATSTSPAKWLWQWLPSSPLRTTTAAIWPPASPSPREQAGASAAVAPSSPWGPRWTHNRS